MSQHTNGIFQNKKVSETEKEKKACRLEESMFWSRMSLYKVHDIEMSYFLGNY
jgi:hypothetical protein